MLEKIIGEVDGPFNIITIIEMACSIILFILGISLFTNSYISMITLSIVSGLGLIIYGISSLIYYFKRGDIVIYNNNIIYGIVFIIISILTMVINKILIILLGIYLLIVGFQRINYAILLKRFNEVAWLLTLVVGIMFIIISIIVFFANEDSIVKITGIYFMAFGLLVLINTLLLRQRSKYFIA